MEKILFPVKIMCITQKMGVGTHKGTKAIDLGWVNEENKKVYAPFTGKIARIYTGSNSVWLQSTEKVMFADGTVDYATARFVHDDNVSDLKVGQVIKQGEYFYKMGKHGKATGVHLHLEIAKGHNKSYNTAGTSMINTVNVYDGFFVTDETQLMKDGGYKWKNEKTVNPTPTPTPTPQPSTELKVGDTVIISGKLYKTANSLFASGSVKSKKTKITRYVKGTLHPYNTTGDLGWMSKKDIKKA